jgi:hypothetical protein
MSSNENSMASFLLIFSTEVLASTPGLQELATKVRGPWRDAFGWIFHWFVDFRMISDDFWSFCDGCSE